MTTYKPGGVSEALFGKKKSSKNDSLLTELFSSPKFSPSVKKEQPITPKQSFQVSHALTDPLDSKQRKKKIEPSSKGLVEVKQTKERETPKRKVEKIANEEKVKPDVTDQRQILREKINPKETVKSNDDRLTDFPVMHETLLQSKSTPKSAVKKRKNDDKDKDEIPAKKMKRHVRDETKDLRTIFIGNCSLSADKKSLKDLFRKFGAIESMRFRCAPAAQLELPRRAVVIKKDFHEQSSSLVAYIVFKEEDAAQAAISMNGHILQGLHLRVDLASQSKKYEKKKSIFLGNLPFDTKEEELRAHFEDCGDIENIRVIRDRRTSLGKGIAYVQFQSKDSVSLALKLDVSKFKGRPIRVRVCTNNPDKIEERKARTDSSASHTTTPKEKKISFAPSNMTSSSFQTVFKFKKEKRMRKVKKKRENSKKTDSLSVVFGDDVQKNTKLKLKKKGPNFKNAREKKKAGGFKGSGKKSFVKGSKKSGSKFKSKSH